MEGCSKSLTESLTVEVTDRPALDSSAATFSVCSCSATFVCSEQMVEFTHERTSTGLWLWTNQETSVFQWSRRCVHEFVILSFQTNHLLDFADISADVSMKLGQLPIDASDVAKHRMPGSYIFLQKKSDYFCYFHPQWCTSKFNAIIAMEST